jgi:hypothetical protein
LRGGSFSEAVELLDQGDDLYRASNEWAPEDVPMLPPESRVHWAQMRGEALIGLQSQSGADKEFIIAFEMGLTQAGIKLLSDRPEAKQKKGFF